MPEAFISYAVKTESLKVSEEGKATESVSSPNRLSSKKHICLVVPKSGSEGAGKTSESGNYCELFKA
jgi:hypothetical protein